MAIPSLSWDSHIKMMVSCVIDKILKIGQNYYNNIITVNYIGF